jgi:hypothetical protein
MHSVTGSRTVDAFSILRSCQRRFSPSTSLILWIGCSRACGPAIARLVAWEPLRRQVQNCI